MVSIRDVARAANVSTATVARVLQDSPRVSAELTARVREVIARMNYVPNAVARSLSQGRTHLIGLLVPDIANPFFAEVTRGLEDGVAPHGYNVLVASSDHSSRRERELAAAFESGTVDAVAITSSDSDTAHVERLTARGLPLAFIDRRPAGTRAPAVLINNAAAAQSAIEYLAGLGHRRIAMISGPRTFSTAADRVAGFRRACRLAGIRLRPAYVREGFLGIDGGAEAMRALLAISPRPTAVLSFNNLVAVGALRAIREARLRIPDDLSVLTFDDMSLFPYTDPPITAISQPAYEMGASVAALLLRMLEATSTKQPDDVVLGTELRIRDSCAPPVKRPTQGDGSSRDRVVEAV